MATYYLDYENGSDSNDGSSWANAWKTITNGATAARIAPGDIIRIAKSPAPTSIGNATWTNGSKTVTLASAQTQNIDLCESAWTASTNVTCSTSTTQKEGTYSCQIAIADAFTTGKAAYRNLGSTLNLSSYQKISFWIRNNAAISANYLRICLCSDTSGNTIVDSFYIPAIPSTNRWLPLTLTRSGGGNLGSSIQSIALYADTDPGAVTILLDDIIACTTNGLNLQSLISKNSAAQGGTEGWYGIQSINGTTIMLDTETNTEAESGRGYSGTTETVTTYKRETIKTSLAASGTTAVQEVRDSGTSGNNIQFQGGYDTSTSQQDGETFFDGLNGNGYGLYLNGKSYITLNYLNFCRYNYGIHYSSSNNNSITTLSNANNNYYGIYYSAGNNNSITTLSNANNNYYNGIHYYSSNNNSITTLSNANNNGLSGIHYSFSNNNSITTLSNANNNGLSGIFFNGGNNNIIYSLSTSGNETAGIRTVGGSRNYIFNAMVNETTGVSAATPFANSRLFSHNHGQTANNHKIFTDGGLISSETSIRHTASGISWKLSPTSTGRSQSYPLELCIARIAVAANKQVTVKAWFRRDNTGITGRLICKGGQIAGVSSDVYDDMTASADTWEELEISFTPTAAGVVEIHAQAWGGTTYSVYVDDLTITQE